MISVILYLSNALWVPLSQGDRYSNADLLLDPGISDYRSLAPPIPMLHTSMETRNECRRWTGLRTQCVILVCSVMLCIGIFSPHFDLAVSHGLFGHFENVCFFNFNRNFSCHPKLSDHSMVPACWAVQWILSHLRGIC